MSELKVYRDPKEGPCWREFYEKSEADKVIAELKSDIADLRDDKKLTDAILDECNAEIAELKKERDWLAKDRAQAYDDLEKRAQLNIKKEESIRHHKYKRCLDKAEICRQKWCTLYYERKNYRENPFLDYLMSKKNRHKEKWLELADKFKEKK